MGYIYKITNLINNKIYIGQTINSLKTRMDKHISKAYSKSDVTGIDGAIRKYGCENFVIDLIYECPDEELNQWEQFYIKKYNTFLGEGYNLTSGGQEGSTSLFLNEEEIVKKYQEEEKQTIKELAKQYNCCEKTISDILHKNNVIVRHNNNIQNLQKGHFFKDGDNSKKVHIQELNLDFNSLKECSQWLIDNGYSSASTMEMARKSLSRVLNGERKTYCKLHFNFIDG